MYNISIISKEKHKQEIKKKSCSNYFLSAAVRADIHRLDPRGSESLSNTSDLHGGANKIVQRS